MKFFIDKTEHKIESFPLMYMMRLAETKGDVGLEIEVEGNKFPKHAYEGYDAIDAHLIPKAWTYHRDGSLRGQDNAEYVLKKPLDFNKTEKAVTDLWSMFSDYGTVLEESNRTSVHVHLNVQQFHLNRLCSFMCLYFSVEELLTQWCGEHRVGNLFCLRAKDAPGIISELKKFFQNNASYKFKNGMHYAGLNALALQKFGSIEVRSLRGCHNPEEIIQWLQILKRIYDLSEEYTDPRMVVEGYSGEGTIGYLERVLGPHLNTVIQGAGMSTSELNASVHEGIRLAQDLAYCTDWSNFRFIEIKEDPFGRKPSKKTAMSLFQAIQTSPQPVGVSDTDMQWIYHALPPLPEETIPEEFYEEDYEED